MSEMVVWVVSQRSDDPYIDAQCWKAGDVICVMEDGHPFSEAEKTNPDWKIVKFPGVPASDLAAFTAPELETDTVPNRMRQKRLFRFDDSLQPVRKPTLQDPNVL